jgi:protein tyrosine phosphatase (PTP) superfamily phosphohydrolase (DUF442 family)
MSIEDSYNFRRIDDRLTTSGVVSAEQLAQLGGEGYVCVINLLPADSEYAVADERDLVEGQGIDYVHIPVDFAAPTEADFDAFATAMDAHHDSKVHVHCAANYRVSAFYSAYARRRGLLTEAEADELVRGLWNPDEHPAWQAFIRSEPV